MSINVPKIRSFLWLAFAATFPLLAVDWFRFALIGHIAIPMVVLGTWVGVEVLATLMGAPARPPRGASFGLIAPLAIAFLAWHVLETPRADDTAFATMELTKLAIDVAVLLLIVARVPRDPKLMERMWVMVVLSSTALFLFLLYQSVVVFGAAYLVSELGLETKVGKNQLSWYLNFFMPFALACLVRTRRWLPGFALAVLGVAWIYLSSRSAWITVTGAFLTMAWTARRVRTSQRLGWRFVVAIVFVGGVTGLLWSELSKTLVDNEVVLRLTSIYNPAGVDKYNQSYEVRGARVAESLELFWSSPVYGIGLTNQKTGAIGYPHDDYAGLLAETGAVGLLLFLAILVLIGWRLRPGRLRRIREPSWVAVGYRGVYIALIGSMVFTDTYTTLSLWVFFGLALAWSDTEALEAARSV